MPPSYTKLWSFLLDSSVWQEDDNVRLVWVTMLAMVDRRGRVLAAVPGLAARARVSLEKTQEALTKLLAPDPYSRTKDHDGRRIEEIDGGWKLLNYDKFRELRNEESARESKRKWWREHRARKSLSQHALDQKLEQLDPNKPKSLSAKALDQKLDTRLQTRPKQIDTEKQESLFLPAVSPASLSLPAVEVPTCKTLPARDVTDSFPETETTPVSGTPQDEGDVLLTFATDGTPKTWSLYEGYVQELSEAYPSLDILAEARKAKAWIDAASDRRKTARGMKKFLVGWLGKAQNSGFSRRSGAVRTHGGVAKGQAHKSTLGGYRKREVEIDLGGD